MKKILFTLLFLASFSAFSQGGIWWRTNKAYGEQKYRSAFDSTLFFPTGNGTPKLNSINLGQSAFYYDSAAKKLYVFSPSDSTWDDYTPGGSVDLQGATDNGNETTNSIVVNGETKGIYVASIADPLKYAGAFTRSGQPVLYVGTGSPGSAVFVPPVSGFTQDNEITLPDSSGKLVLRINNISPDSKGNVTISTGGVSPSDTAAMLAAYLRKVDTADLSRKQMGAYTFRANNTSSAANATELVYKSFTNLTYGGTVTWTHSGTAPSGTPVVRYSWSQINKDVWLSMTCYYPTNGTSVTAATFTWPSDVPLPLEPTGTGAADDVLYSGTGFITTNYATEPTIAGRAFVKVNTGDTGYEFKVVSSSVSARYCIFNIKFTAQ